MANQQFAKRLIKRKTKRNVKGKGLTKKQKMQVAKLIKAPVEIKYYDTTFDAISASLAPIIDDISAPAEGTGEDQRIGSNINLESIQYNLCIVKADDTNVVRIAILQWFPDAENDYPSWQQLFQYHTAGSPSGLQQLMSPYQLGQGGTRNFRFLMDEIFYLDSDNPMQFLKGYINKGFKKGLECNGTSERGTNHIYLLYASDSGVTTHPLIYGDCRVRYSDQ